ncbi:MAG: hypothetical protein J5611_00840 [Alphaproteobacteria bacterium]|nr:hypothetical protein [Alphaproteobacteria bacterium]
MKKLLFVILSLFAVVAYADNTITSKEYVDGQVSNLQTQIPAKNTNTVVMNTGSTGTIGEKAIYDTSAAYGAQSDALVTAGAFNSAMQNALESEFVCVEWQGSVHDNAHCLLYEVRGATQMQTLPAGYTQLEYIESTGTQYIDTGINVSATTGNNIRIESDGNFGTAENGWAVDGSGHPYLQLYIGLDPNRYIAFGNNWGDVKTTFRETDVSGRHLYKVDYINGVVSRDDIILTNFTTKLDPQASAHNLFIFGWTPSRELQINAKKYGVKIYSLNTIIFNGVPAQRDSDGELGMYDLVSGTFFTNAGAGEFIAGPVASYLPQGN